jgi:RimJ/RimL family protein N-acetyltransferase
MRIEKQVLAGQRVRLEPLTAAHLAGLADAVRDGELWKIPVTIVPPPDQLDGFLAAAEAAFSAGRELAYATIDIASGTVVGSTRFRCIEAAHRRVEIGFTFLAASWQQTHINTEAKYLMLRHAFEHWEVNRVELLTDVLNDKSRRAIARIGAQQEGILRSHMVMRDGRLRDSVIFSLIRREWPETRIALERKLVRV